MERIRRNSLRDSRSAWRIRLEGEPPLIVCDSSMSSVVLSTMVAPDDGTKSMKILDYSLPTCLETTARRQKSVDRAARMNLLSNDIMFVLDKLGKALCIIWLVQAYDLCQPITSTHHQEIVTSRLGPISSMG